MVIDLQETAVASEMIEAACRLREKPRTYIGMSGAGNPCELALWYAWRGFTPAPMDGRALMIFDLGNRVEEAVIHWLTAAGYKIDGRQDTFSDLGGQFKGHCDGIIEGITSRRHILEIKSANDRKFNLFRNQGIAATSPEYAAQVQLYMGYAGLERALWVVMNKNTCEIYTERAHFDRAEFDRLRARAVKIMTAHEKAELETDTANCQWCQFKSFCQGDGMQTEESCRSCGFLEYSASGEPRCTFREHPYPIKDVTGTCSEYLFINEYTFLRFQQWQKIGPEDFDPFKN